MQIILINGKVDVNPSPNSRAMAFGDGLFETLLVKQGKAALLDLHAGRLQQGCKKLLISLDINNFYQDIQRALQHIQNVSEYASISWRLKYVVSRGDSRSGYAFKPDIEPQRILLAEPFVRDVAVLHDQGVRVRCCDWQLPKQPALAGLKHLNRLDQIMARAEWSVPQIFEGLMADTSGYWIEGTMSNLFIVDAFGRLITPDLRQSGVSGVMRRFVIEHLCTQLKLDVTEKKVSSVHLQGAQEIFLTNALIGIVPVNQLDDKVLAIGSVTRSLQARLAATHN